MKYVMIAIIFLVACSKEVDHSQELFAKGGKGRGKPVKDTVIVIPPDTTVIDTVIVVPYMPSSYRIPNVPTAINQGSEGSCVPIALVYAHTLLTGQLMSPEWLYNNTKVGSCPSGASIITGLNYLVNKGGKTWEEVPYSDKNSCDPLPGEGTHKISGWKSIKATDTTAIKAALLAGYALPFTYALDYAVYTNQLWEQVTYPVYGPHAVALIGWDEEAFIFLSTYGPTWGTNGTNRVKKSAFKDLAYEVFQLIK